MNDTTAEPHKTPNMSPLAASLNACLTTIWTSRVPLGLEELAWSALQRRPVPADLVAVEAALRELEARGQAVRADDGWRPNREPIAPDPTPARRKRVRPGERSLF